MMVRDRLADGNADRLLAQRTRRAVRDEVIVHSRAAYDGNARILASPY